jgi:hypothetical protein
MPLSNPDGTIITCTGIVSAIAGVVVTILKLKPSKPEMQPVPPDVLELIRKLTESSHGMQLDIKGISSNLNHLHESIKTMEKRVEADHLMIKLLRETLIAWGRLDALKTAPLNPE